MDVEDELFAFGTMMMVINERLRQDVEDEGKAIHLVDV